MGILIVGSVGLDDLETPFGAVSSELGGAAVYSSLVASLYHQVGLVGVVGTDFPAQHRQLLDGKGIDTSGLEIREGRTFHWKGKYGFDLNTAITLDTQLNVFSSFDPVILDHHKDSRFVFLANIDPDLQFKVLKQVNKGALIALDTMNFWIESKRDALTRALREVNVVFMNEAEAREYAGTSSLIAAARHIRDIGPEIVVIKRGEYGAMLFSDHSYFVAPAYPLEEVRDPTGAGDTFAGGFMGYLAAVGQVSAETLRQALVHGTVVASFTVEDFGTRRISGLDKTQVLARYRELRSFACFEDDLCWGGLLNAQS